MPSLRALLVLALAFTTSYAKHLPIPLKQHRGEHATGNSIRKRSSSHPFPTAPETLGPVGFWYGLFDVGTSKNLRLVIDTGSSYVQVDPNLYKPGPDGTKLKQRPASQELVYGTAQPNGCGSLNVTFERWQDTMTFQGLTAKWQHVAIGQREKSIRPGEETQLPPRT